MKQKAGKLLKTSGAVCLTAAVASMGVYVTTRYLSKVAFNREEPETFKKAGNAISGTQSGNAFLEELQKCAEHLKQEENETVQITAQDGTPLVGHWIPCENAKRIIIAMHGWRSAWYKDFGMVSDFWENHDCSVLYAEQRGQGNSGGDFIGFGPIERYDCLDWIRWVSERCGSNAPIYLCGVSMGATTVLMAAGLDLPANVHGIMADCGFTSPHAIWKHVANNNLHISFRLRGIMADTLYERKTQSDAAFESTVDALRQSTVPVMLVHGTDDHFVPIEMTFENYTACAGPKKLFIVPEADHGMSYFVDRKGYEAAALEFWQQFDAPVHKAEGVYEKEKRRIY